MNRDAGASGYIKYPPLAICAYSYRLPGNLVTDEDLWTLLKNRDVVQVPVEERYGRGCIPFGNYPPGQLRLVTPYEGLMAGGGSIMVDPALFALSESEANGMDPQMLMVLSCAWEATERAGWPHEFLSSSPTGVFIGAQTSSAGSWRPLAGGSSLDVLNSSLALLANRVSFHLNLEGPSVVSCTACSAGFTALHAAATAFATGDCRQALVGACSFLGSGHMSGAFSRLGVNSPDGTCYSFDARANGYMRSEGAMIFAVKPLHLAEEDGDNILAVVESTAVNTAGRADGTSGLAPGRFIAAPTQHAQVKVMREAVKRAGRRPKDIDYIEAHATGTTLGDRIEGNSILEAYGNCGRTVPLKVSTVKSNLGHLEAGAFGAGLLKVLMMMQRRTFAPISRNFQIPNPDIDFKAGPMEVQTSCEPFPERQVVMGINSFGFGGTNGHCVVSEYVPDRSRVWSVPTAPDAGYLIPLSARTSDALVATAKDLSERIAAKPVVLYSLAGTLSRRRTHHTARTSFGVTSLDELRSKLDAFVANQEPLRTAVQAEKRIAFVFTGQGNQWTGCGKSLYETHPVFRCATDAVEEAWLRYANFSLRDACFGATQEDLNQVSLAQPAIFLIQVGLVELLKVWGVYADVVIGHSSGELAAAYASGLLSLEDAVRLTYERARLQQKVSGSGRMLPIGMDVDGVQRLLQELASNGVEIACVNSPASTVVCGAESALEPVVAACRDRNILHKLLRGNIAFHSSAMDHLRSEVLNALAFLDGRGRQGEVPMISTVTGAVADRMDAQYWWSNIRQPVQFRSGMDTIRKRYDPDLVIELGPHPALRTMVVQCYEQHARQPAIVGTLVRNEDSRRSFLETLGALYRDGVALDFAAQYPRPPFTVDHLPRHPVNSIALKHKYVDDEFSNKTYGYSAGPLLGKKLISQNMQFEALLSQKAFPYLLSHEMENTPIMPAAGYIEMILEAMGGDTAVCIESIEFLAQCAIPVAPTRMLTVLTAAAGRPDTFDFKISTRAFDQDQDTLHASGRVRRIDPAKWTYDGPRHMSEIDLSGFTPETAGDDLYDTLEAGLAGVYKYGPEFRVVKSRVARHATKETFVEMEVDEDFYALCAKTGYVLCPQFIDGGTHAFICDLFEASDLVGVPRRALNVTYFKPPTSPRVNCLAVSRFFSVDSRGQHWAETGELLSGDLSFFDAETGDLLFTIGKWICLLYNANLGDTQNTKYEISWQPKFISPVPDAALTPTALIDALSVLPDGIPRVCHMLEYARGCPSESTFLHGSLKALAASQHEYWLASESEESSNNHFNAFGHNDISLRFPVYDADPKETPPDLSSGLLRAGSVSLLLLHGDAATFSNAAWMHLHQLMVPGGLALISGLEQVQPFVARNPWTVRRRDGGAVLLRAETAAAEPSIQTVKRWVLGDMGGLVNRWAQMHEEAHVIQHGSKVFSTDLARWPGAREVEAIDYFCRAADPDDATGESLTWQFMVFVRALAQYRIQEALPDIRLTVITQGAVMDVTEPRMRTLWGAVRTIHLEFGTEVGIELRLVDLGDISDLPTLHRLDGCGHRELALAVRNGRVYAERILKIREGLAQLPPEEDAAYELCSTNTGQISGIELRTKTLPPLGSHDVVVKAVAAALNFRDIMVVLQLLPLSAYERSSIGQRIGFEGSGIIAQVGDQVTSVQPGDRVCYTSPGSIANRLQLPERMVMKVPETLTMLEAAGFASVYTTAYYALIHLARVRSSHTVLIHSAMGGVGQAAIQLVRLTGAQFYATAGSDEKRQKLREMGALGTFDSHGHDWHRELMQATGGEGVDIVLNSLAGIHLLNCLDSLKPGGWHCEIGKVDVFADSQVGLRVFRRNLRFAAIDMDRLALDDPALTLELHERCLALLAEKRVEPPQVTAFPYRDYEKAMRMMMAGKHTGKLILTAPEDRPEMAVTDQRPYLDPAATYLITGGLGDLGSALLRYLACAGARHVTLMDRDPHRRRSEQSVRDKARLSLLDSDLDLDIVYGNVTEAEDVERVIRDLKRPLKGVFHLAGVNDDKILINMSLENVRNVFRPKALGALNLHKATADEKLDCFVMFSSIASVLGNGGQSNYGAANAFLDGLAAYRRARGLPALSVNLAGVTELGMAARSVHTLRLMRMLGLPPVSAATTFADFDYAMRRRAHSGHMAILNPKNPQWDTSSSDYLRLGRLQTNLATHQRAASVAFTIESVIDKLGEKVSELSGYEDIGADEPLSLVGLTSVSVTELASFIQTTFQFRVSTLELMTTATLKSLAVAIMQLEEKEAREDDSTEGTANQAEASVRALRRASRKPSAFAIPAADHFATRLPVHA